MREHDYEPIPGLPEKLPAGEVILWQGAPVRRAFAIRCMHLPLLAGYFGLMVLARAGTVLWEGASAGVTARDALWFILPSLGVLGLAALLSWAVARTTVYTITNRRLVFRIGIALSMTVNLPFSIVQAAAARLNPDGSGDISVTLSGTDRISYLFFWPHVRPWRITRPQPTLRAVADAAAVAQLLSRALAAASAVPVRTNVAAAEPEAPRGAIQPAAA